MTTVKEKGKIVLIGQVASGKTSEGFQWARQEIVVRVDDGLWKTHPLALTARNDRCYDIEKFKVGDKVEVEYAVSSRLWNGKYYTDVTLVGIASERVEAEGRAIEAAEAVEDLPEDEEKGCLPF